MSLPAECARCDDELVSLAFDEDLGVDEEIRAHAASCPRCRAELEALRQTRSLLSLPLEEPSKELDARLLAAAEDFLADRPLDEHLRLESSAPPKLSLLPGGAEASAPKARAATAWWRAPLAAAATLALLVGGSMYLTPEGTQHPKAAAEPEMKTELFDSEPTLLSGKAEERAAAAEGAKVAEKPAPGKLEDSAGPGLSASRGDASARGAGARPSAPAPAPPTRAAAPSSEFGNFPGGLSGQASAPAATSELSVGEESPRRPAPSMAKRVAVEDAVEAEAMPVARSLGSGMRMEESPPSTLAQARSAAESGEHQRAADLYAALMFSPANREEFEAAVEGRARALLALGRVEEAQAVVRRLPAESEVRASLLLLLDRERAKSAPAASDTDAH